MLSLLRKIYNSIALLPTGIALFFAAISIVQIVFPFAQIKFADSLQSVVITSKSDLQFIFAFIIGGIFTLTIFSYTMVMNVLNRSINNYSPRLIPLILAERHHQLILGFTSGTIIYAMIMSIAVSKANAGAFPPFGAFLGIVFSIFCVFLFIYFIHSVSQSIHVNYVLRKSYDRSLHNLNNVLELEKYSSLQAVPENTTQWNRIEASDCGYLQLPEFKDLAQIAHKQEAHILIDVLPGLFVLKGQVLLRTSTVIEDKDHNFSKQVSVDSRVPLELNETEIKHLVEVAVKASSPAINDPGTSLTAIDYITQLLVTRNQLKECNAYSIDNQHYVYVKQLSNKELARYCFKEMNHYMKTDPILKEALSKAINILQDHGVVINHDLLD